MNEIAPIEGEAIWRPSAALNPQRLDYLWSLAERMAAGTTVPESLRGEREGSRFTPFDHQTIVANVFAVVEQADRWNVSPFALISAAAIVRGKLTFEGKVIAAVLEAQFGVKLYPYYRGKPGTDNYHVYLCDQELPDDILAQLEPGYRHDRYRIMDGSVGKWKTTGNGSPWRPDTYADMLIYRGVRQWCRVHKSAVILGVLADDEIEHAALEHAAQNAVPISQRFSPGSAPGFSPDNVTKALEDNSQTPMELVDQKTGEVITTEAQPASPAKNTMGGRKETGNESVGSPASEKPSSSPSPSADGDDGGAGSAGSSQPDNSSPAPSGDDGGDAAPETSKRVSASQFMDYHKALARMASAESIKKANGKFWEGAGFKPSHPDDRQLFKDLLENHIGRVNGQVDAQVLADSVKEWVAKVTGEAVP